MNTQKGFSTVLSLLLAVVVIGGGLYWYKAVSNKSITDDAESLPESIPAYPTSVTPTPKTQTTPAQSAPVLATPTSQTYFNSTYGFQLNYPEGWRIGSETGSFDNVGYDLNISFCPTSLYENQNCKYEKTSAQSGRSFAPILLSVMKVDSDAARIRAGSNVTVVKGSSYAYRITLNDPAFSDEYTQLIASLKVTK